MYLKSLQKLRCPGWISKQDLLRFAVKETMLNSWKDDFLTERVLLSTERKRSIHLNFPFSFVSFNSVLLSLKCKTSVLKTTAFDNQSLLLTIYGVIRRWLDSFSSVFYTLIKHAFFTYQIAHRSFIIINEKWQEEQMEISRLLPRKQGEKMP